jgi:hypothetical protein
MRAGKLAFKCERAHGITLRHELRVERSAGKPDERVQQQLGTEAGKTKKLQIEISFEVGIGGYPANPMRRRLEKSQMKDYEDDSDEQVRDKTA